MAKKPEQASQLQLLKQHIKEKRSERLYFFHGEESFLLHHYLQQLKKLLIDDLTESFNFHKFNNENFDLRSLADAVENLPMMAEATMVVVDDIDIFDMEDVDRSRLIDVFSDIPEYCTVVFIYETQKWKPDKRLKKLWDAVQKHGCIVEFAKQDQRELVTWITRHFLANQKRISPELCTYLIDMTGGTMTALAGEIAKICAYSGSDTITKSDIDAVTEPVLDAVVFQMTDLLGRGQTGEALIKLQQLLKMQQDPIYILGAIGGHFRKLGTAKTVADNGGRSVDVENLCNIRDYAARKTMEASRGFSAEFYTLASELVMETDRQLKTSHDDPKRLLELLVLRLAQEAKHG